MEAASRSGSATSDNLDVGSDRPSSTRVVPCIDSKWAARFAAKQGALIRPAPAVAEPTTEVADEEDLNIGLFVAGPQPAPCNDYSASEAPSDIADSLEGSRSCIQSFSAIAEEFAPGE